jgi:hypothetical protein
VESRIGTAGVLRFAVVALMALSLLMAATLAAPTRADAHQTAGSTRIFIDGKRVLLTPDDHFTFTKVLSRGCHDVRVVQWRHGHKTLSQGQSNCSKKRTTLTIAVNHKSVSMDL